MVAIKEGRESATALRPPGSDLVREVDGIKVFVRVVTPSQVDMDRYDAWWRGVIGRRLVGK